MQLTQHDVPLIVHEAKQCITQGYSFADIIEVITDCGIVLLLLW